jgi:hypothetical protein
VLRGKEVRHWGLEVPWRVKSITVKSSKKLAGSREVLVEVRQDADEASKKKPGKKRRIILREKKREIEKREEQKRKEKENKEEAEREKRTRRNREKKVKKKMKEKALKAGNGVGTGGDETKDNHSGSD